jgi:hypothetical protein
MGIIVPSIPKAGTGPQPATDLVSSLNTIIAVLNGGIDDANLKDYGLSELPVEQWNEIKVKSSAKIMAGPYTAGFPPEYVFGPQQIGTASVPSAASNVLREVGITVTYTKSEKFAGGNATENGLAILGFKSDEEFVFGASIPGSDGVRTERMAGLVPVTPADFEGYPVNMGTYDAGQQMVMPDVGGIFQAVATGPFTGTHFTVHELIIRYRDWEF